MRWRRWLGLRDRRTEARDEIEAHIRLAIEDRIERGETPDAARRHAYAEFGSVRAAIDDARGVWGWPRVEQLAVDARSGARILRSAPGLSVTAILLVALVIGGNTTIYSAVHAMLTKPAPGVRAGEIVSVGWRVDSSPIVQTDIDLHYYTAIAEQSRLMRAAAFRAEQIGLTHGDGTFAVRGSAVSPGFLSALGITPLRGRDFTGSDAAPGTAGLVAIISERLWTRQFAGNDAAIGAAIAIDGRPATIIGITPAPFQGAWLAEATDVWIPLGARNELRQSPEAGAPRAMVDGIIGRRVDGASRGEIEAELGAIAARVHATERAGAPRHDPVALDYTGIAGRNNMLGRFGPKFLTIFSIVTLLTVCIVCANVANLMLARAVSRQREMAVRQSFGASRWRITRLVLAENLTLALAAWAAACVFAWWVSRMLPGIIPASESGGADVLLDFTPDWIVIVYALLLSLAAAISFTAAPAIRTWRQDLLSFLKAGERGIVQGRSRATRTLVIVQLALSVVLLVSAGLAYRSLSFFIGRDVGFPTENILLVTVDAAAAAPTPAAKVRLLQTMLDRVVGTPGVRAATFADHGPSQSWPSRAIGGDGLAQPVRAERNEVGPGFLKTLGLGVIHGRDFDHRATGRAEAIVNQHLADALWPGESPLGRTIALGNLDASAVIVGVAPNALVGGYRRDEHPRLVLLSSAHTQRPGGFTTFQVRFSGDLDAAVPAITRAMRDAAPGVPVTYIRTMEMTLHEMTWMYRTLTTLLVLFAGGSLFIAALGQYAAMSFAIRQRVRDFAIRMAMGASSRQIMTSALREGFVLTGVGLALGIALGVIAGRGGRALLHGVTPTDAMTYAGVLLVLGAASLAACYVPALRASRVDPIEALRAE